MAVITAASLIMILVFGAFVRTGQLDTMQAGAGFATAILVDAYIIRTVLVPSVMHMPWHANSWLPAGWTESCLDSDEALMLQPSSASSAPFRCFVGLDSRSSLGALDGHC